MSLEWRAPSSLRISVFFKITSCSDWDDVEAYLKVAKVRESAEEYYETYIHELEVIKDSDSVPKEVQRTVRNILSKTNMKAFLNTYRTWILDNEKEEAEASIAVGYARLAKRAGLVLQREGDKKCKGHTREEVPVVHKETASDCRQSTPPPCIPGLVEDIRFEGSTFWNMIGMPPVWHAGDINISSEFIRAKVAIQAEYPAICLCKDNIADFGHDGELQDFMEMAGYSTALDALPSMPGLPLAQKKLLDDLFGGRVGLETLSKRIDNLMKVPDPVPPLNRYIFTAFQPYRGFMNTGMIINPDINERQFFRDYVVELLRGALWVYDIPYAWGEINVPAVSYRKAKDADATGRGKFADGSSEVDGHQIIISESSKLYRATATKDLEDRLKLKRMLRDLFNFTILQMTRNKVRAGPKLTVFGTRTYKDTTELIAMDYHGMYRAYCLGSFKIATAANTVANLKESFEMCLRFAAAVKEQISQRSEMGMLGDVEVLKLTQAAKRLLKHTSCTPPKPPVQGPSSPSKPRAQKKGK